MATGGGFDSSSSNEIYSGRAHTNDGPSKPVCDPCKQEDGSALPARAFCSTCHEYMCDMCYAYHRRQKISRYHSVISGRDMPKRRPRAQRNLNADLDECKKHTGEMVKYICLDHNAIGCVDCITLEHRACENAALISGISRNAATLLEFDIFKSNMHALRKKLVNEMTKIEENKKRMNSLAEKAECDVRKLRSEIEQKIVALEAVVLKEIQKETTISYRKIDDIYTKMKQIDSDVRDLAQGLNDLEVEDRKSRLFILWQKSSSSLAEWERDCRTLAESNHIPPYKFQPDLLLNDVLLHVTTLGQFRALEIESESDSSDPDITRQPSEEYRSEDVRRQEGYRSSSDDVRRQEGYRSSSDDIRRQEGYCSSSDDVRRQEGYRSSSDDVRRQEGYRSSSEDVQRQEEYRSSSEDVQRQEEYRSSSKDVQRQDNSQDVDEGIFHINNTRRQTRGSSVPNTVRFHNQPHGTLSALKQEVYGIAWLVIEFKFGQENKPSSLASEDPVPRRQFSCFLYDDADGNIIYKLMKEAFEEKKLFRESITGEIICNVDLYEGIRPPVRLFDEKPNVVQNVYTEYVERVTEQLNHLG